MSLSETVISKTQYQDKPFNLADSAGLYLLAKPNGAKLWHLKYHHGGKERKLAFGAYFAVSLTLARNPAARPGIFPENADSVRLHEKSGFRIIGFREKSAR
ncbi:hypothetical protein BMI79_11060 [Serratia oryzae]|jgi:hypothetical protein|uniref:Integrase DNA-binding domain-containing protein n=1 Tax=Serratia oryzae TaxID=2034155 RepID=A0A1S8CLI1_9GAMM|nr:hypothetical protein BMI79_11060 [Serratia oryzae]